MPETVEVRTTVLPGHRIEIQRPELPEGREATVIITLDEEPPKRRFWENARRYPRGRLFHCAEEVDDYLRQERESWDK